MPVHPVASAGFNAAADAYDRGRPGYPEVAIRALADHAGLGPGSTVVDLAAGTGKLSLALAATGTEVIAVEPVAAMRQAIDGGIRALDGTAEAIPVVAAAADVVTVGQAFHWFDGEATLSEIHRVLRSAGSLALFWNVRRMDDPLHAAIEALIEPHCRQVPRHRTSPWRDVFERTALFGPLEDQEFPNEQRLDADGLAARVGSISAIAALPASAREDLLADVRSLADAGPVMLRYDCRLQIARRLGEEG